MVGANQYPPFSKYFGIKAVLMCEMIILWVVMQEDTI